MFVDIVCPGCFDGMHSACTGTGCNCDCQFPEDAIAMGVLEDLYEQQAEAAFLENGYD